MKLHILSDLHLSQEGFEPPPTDADLVILAGDIARPPAALAWAQRLGKPALYVPGNHEFYGHSLTGTCRLLRELSAGTAVTVLDASVVVHGGVRFIGTTLWTDFGLETDPGRRAAAQAEALAFIRDFSRIRLDDTLEGEAPSPLFSPAHSAALHAEQAAWLDAQLGLPFDGPTVVVTHHAPSARSIHPRWAGSLVNGAFVSNADALLDGRAVLWVHGHTHDSFDYTVRGTRVVCNPRGYARGGVVENQNFRPGWVLEV